MAGEKTEKATPKRRRDERKKGNIFQSREVVSVCSLIIIFYAFKFLAPTVITSIGNNIKEYIGLLPSVQEVTASEIRAIFIDGCMVFAITAIPIALIAALAAVILTGAQTRFLFASKLLAPKFSRINPLQGIKRLFSMRGLVELAKSIIKIVVLGIVIYNVLSKDLPSFPRMMDMSIGQVMAQTGNIILDIVKTAVIIFAFLAAADYAYQWWDYEKNLRMSKQEIKEEYKQTEGDPQVKGKIRERQHQQARQRMMQAVPTADVVIRNPTHYAVALSYHADKNRAPVVVAKGADHLALKIVEIAEENKVIVLENRPLARGLYETVDLDQEIPEKFFKPVAEVLAYVYNLKERDRK